MPDLKLLLLGSPRIEHHDDELKVETRKTIALAAYLAVTGTAQRREHLATLLWPESDQARARASLRYTLSALREQSAARISPLTAKRLPSSATMISGSTSSASAAGWPNAAPTSMRIQQSVQSALPP